MRLQTAPTELGGNIKLPKYFIKLHIRGDMGVAKGQCSRGDEYPEAPAFYNSTGLRQLTTYR